MIAGEYTYPDWSINLGWVLTASSISCIPAYIIYLLCITPGPFLHVSYAADYKNTYNYQ